MVAFQPQHSLLSTFLTQPTRESRVIQVDSARASTLKPPLKWAGGKRWLVPHVRPIWERYSHRRYVEPFCGGLALPLAFTPEQALLNDTNRHLITFYHWLQDGLESTSRCDNDRDLYYHHRAAFNEHVTRRRRRQPTAAERFYYLNRTCYNGLVPLQPQRRIQRPFWQLLASINYIRDFYAYQPPLGTLGRSAPGILRRSDLQPDDFIYADPPYDVEFVSYSQQGFNWDDQVRLAEWLAQHHGPVVLSNQATERVVQLYRIAWFQAAILACPTQD